MADHEMPEIEIPDLDPRVDAHLIGQLTWTTFLTLLGGGAGITLGLLIVTSAFHATTWGGLGGLIVTGGLLAWGAIDGPHQWQLRRRYRRSPHVWTVWPGGPWSVPAFQRSDPFWIDGDRVWGMAVLTIPPIAFLDPADLSAWHQRTGAVIRAAAWHQCEIDLGSVQGPGMRAIPPERLSPVLQRRWQWWAEHAGPQSIASFVWVRLSRPGTQRDPVVPHFLAVEQAWASLAGPGEWHWVTAHVAERMMTSLGHPAQDYATWQAMVLDRVQGPALIRRQEPSPRSGGPSQSPRTRVTPFSRRR
ncbi:hypothetical protein [Sulfobacillus thermosulfidooxidans]|uniref:hypothetical protein n=1 Tax=Sulfobacillus thermosulfidooxidans TaxID=28034 RepID=UPI0006B57E9B|nr:hypothetical protein [Sulfobacillus thermosulfidooxidans]